jgi:ATP-dependent DNA helicase
MTMRDSLQKWINDADYVRHLQFFRIPQTPIRLGHVVNRPQDFYISLVGELFSGIKEPDTPRSEWAQLGNAFLQFATEMSNEQLNQYGICKEDAVLFAATSFYFGNYPASAYLAMRRGTRPIDNQSPRAGCFDFLVRPMELRSAVAIEAQEALLSGNPGQLSQLVQNALLTVRDALDEGPSSWIVATLLSRMLRDFNISNVRAVLPNGNDEFWTPLVDSLIKRQPPTWEFFPSQIEAINGGLLSSEETYSLQMPTGAGKTTLCETLLYSHIKRHSNEVAVMLVPYRSLASELRGSLVRRLNAVGIASRCAYGGTVPVGDELHELANVQAIVATPEALSGLLGADPDFARRIGLIIVDEGHLLDGSGRGIGLELLLARMRARADRPTRFVFISAIVPNVEEINTWLGGTDETVIRSTYRPALAEFAVLQSVGTGVARVIDLKMHPQEPIERRFSIDSFLDHSDFTYRNLKTGRQRTYHFNSVKAQAIATARKVLPMGSVAIFAANKRGNQGAIGIAESLVEQLQVDLPIPKPIDFARQDRVQRSIAYLESEYGVDWIGTQCVQHGFVLHHGDIPQESREILEELVREQDVKLVICTNTLAEGVNLPIRTLVLYSVQRRQGAGQLQNMLTRDIKNLVGRAGRAGANTKGLVICANPDQWELVQPVAMQGAGESVRGSLLGLIELMTRFIARSNIALSNQFMEQNTIIHPLIDGVDSTLMELLSDEIGEDEFVDLAIQLAAQTFASRQLSEASSTNLQSVFSLRARNLIELRGAGKILWARATGAKVRLINSVEQNLLPLSADWHANVDSLSDEIRVPVFQWAWTHMELREKVKECFRLGENDDVEVYRDRFFEIARLWMMGIRFREIAVQMALPIGDLLAIYTSGIAFSLQTLVEQGISLLEKRLEEDEVEISDGVRNFPEHLRFGVPNKAAKQLATRGVRHRSACVQLGAALEDSNLVGNDNETHIAAAQSLRQFSEQWRVALGDLVYQNTLSDLS